MPTQRNANANANANAEALTAAARCTAPSSARAPASRADTARVSMVAAEVLEGKQAQ